MKISEVAKRYAKAYYDSVDKGSTESLLNELREVASGLARDPAVVAWFKSPVVDEAAKAKVIEQVLGAKTSKQTTQFVNLLVSKSRLDFISEIAAAFEQLVDAAHGVTRGTIKSAVVLTEEYQKQIKEKVEAVIGKKVIFTYEVDPKLMGGMIAQVGGWTFDDSLESHFLRLNEELNRRAN